jgi:hypothetical protein
VQTQFWSPQRPELNLQEAEVLWLLGFNLVGNQMPEVREKHRFLNPGGHHWVEFGPGLTHEAIEKQIRGPAQAAKRSEQPTLFGFSDEIACRPPIGTDERAKAHFHAWLRDKKVAAKDLGVKDLAEVVPIELPTTLRERQKENRAAANRTFLLTTRFRQEAATERLGWLSETFHKHAPANILTTTLVADHPYFGGSGLGMGMHMENATWGGYPLSLDWFALARHKVVDMIGIEDWMGLQYMYGPSSTWEGFQLMGFQAAIFRSGGRGELPIMAWITPSDETNLRLKTASALCQGASTSSTGPTAPPRPAPRTTGPTCAAPTTASWPSPASSPPPSTSSRQAAPAPPASLSSTASPPTSGSPSATSTCSNGASPISRSSTTSTLWTC